MTKPFDLIYFEYELLHPKLSIITIMRAAPKSVICALILYIISFIVYILYLISYIDSSLAVSVALIFICTAIFASVVEYAVYTVFRELINKRRNRICDLIDDLKFIRIDFGNNRQNKS